MRGRRDALGTVLGLAVFFVGVGLLLLTFKLAYDMFSVPPKEALELKDKETIQLGMLSSTLTGIVKQIILLIVMALVSSFIANRGIHMYTESRALGTKTVDKDEVAKTSENA